MEENWDWKSLTAMQVFILKAGIIVGSGGIIFGYDVGVVAGALRQVTEEFGLSEWEEGFVVSSISLGAIIGCVFGGPICDAIGRWKTIHLQNFLFVGGALCIAFSQNVLTIYIGRIVVGMASALSGIADCSYLSEVSPVCYRGRMSSSFEILTCTGILFSFIIARSLLTVPSAWRIMFGLPALFAFLQSVGMCWLPESPKWLAQKGLLLQCDEVLALMHDNNRESHSFQSMKEGILSEINSSELNKSGATATMLQYRNSILVVVFLQIMSQFTGSIVIRNYAPIILEDAGVSESLSLLLNVALGFVKLIATGFSALYVDLHGRKLLLEVSCGVIGCGMLILAVGFSPLVGLSRSPVLFMCGCFLTTTGYSFGFGPVMWILSTEMFPTAIRGRAVSFSLLVTNISIFITNLFFLPMLQIFSASVTFFIFLIMNVITCCFLRRYMVETNGLDAITILERVCVKFRPRGGLIAVRTRDYEAVVNPL